MPSFIRTGFVPLSSDELTNKGLQEEEWRL